MNNLKLACLGAALAMTLAGCQATPPRPLMTEADPAVQQLNDAAQRVARAAEQASLAQTVRNGPSQVTQEFKIDLTKVPPDMREPLLLEQGFNGPMETFVKSIAAAVGWPAPVIVGASPGLPLMVSFTEQRRPPILWLADAGWQVGNSADIQVNNSLRQIIIRYKDAQGTQAPQPMPQRSPSFR